MKEPQPSARGASIDCFVSVPIREFVEDNHLVLTVGALHRLSPLDVEAFGVWDIETYLHPFG